ncbi:MAG: hypothetical protein HY331_10600 [Chloroflexi bacterium]|nr:hypothetical protein [Chloroflexota bacterium]
MPGWLEEALIDATGETELRQQLEGLALSTLPLKAAPIRTAPLARIADTGVNPYGVNTFLQWQPDPVRLERSMAMLQAAGVGWIRQQFPWSDIEIPAKGQYANRFGQNTWEKYDRLVALADRYHLRILARLDFPPNWTRQDNTRTFAPPDNFDDYGDFVAAVVARYRGRITHYQIWNEPNTETEWGNRPISATDYARLLRVAAERSRAVDPDVVVVSAALAPTLGTPDGRNVSDLAYLQQLYDAGARPFFDVLGVMAYGLWSGPGDRRVEPDRVNFSRPAMIRDIMVRNGDEQKAMWASEVGWNALPADWPAAPSHGRVSEDLQARYAVHAYRRAEAEWPWMGVLFYWHFGLPFVEERDQQMFYFRLADPDLTPRPVYWALRSLVTQPPAVAFGRHQEDHWAIQYAGAWTQQSDRGAALDRFREAREAGSTATFAVRGATLSLRILTGPDAGRLRVALRPSGDNGRAAEVTTILDGSAWPAGFREVTIARSFPPGDWIVTLQALDAGRPVGLDEVVVDSNPTIRWDRLLLSAVIALVGIKIARREVR